MTEGIWFAPPHKDGQVSAAICGSDLLVSGLLRRDVEAIEGGRTGRGQVTPPAWRRTQRAVVLEVGESPGTTLHLLDTEIRAFGRAVVVAGVVLVQDLRARRGPSCTWRRPLLMDDGIGLAEKMLGLPELVVSSPRCSR